jgi:ubiquinone/menaquinone biosynthesis C-methylase UbiE
MPAENSRVYNREIERLRAQERRDRMEVDRVVQLCLEHKNVTSLLDIGTGSGLFAELFSQKGVSVAGVDINPDMIEAANSHLPEGKFVVAPAENLPFADGSFDASFFGVVFHEVDDYAKALREAYRVSKESTFILEWQHKQEEFGPPLEHRLKEEFVCELATSSGYRDVNVIPLRTLVLYRLVK